jgi:hypothetical protein
LPKVDGWFLLLLVEVHRSGFVRVWLLNCADSLHLKFSDAMEGFFGCMFWFVWGGFLFEQELKKGGLDRANGVKFEG